MLGLDNVARLIDTLHQGQSLSNKAVVTLLLDAVEERLEVIDSIYVCGDVCREQWQDLRAPWVQLHTRVRELQS